MEQNDKSTRVEKLWSLIKNNKWISVVIILGTVVIAVGQFTGAVQIIADFICGNTTKKDMVVTHQKIVTLFNRINNEYIKNFKDYLKYFEKGDDPYNIIHQLTYDNKFTAVDRAKLVRAS